MSKPKKKAVTKKATNPHRGSELKPKLSRKSAGAGQGKQAQSLDEIDAIVENFRFSVYFNNIAENVHANARAKGFWDDDRKPAESIALIHSELSEALGAYRNGNPPSEKIPGHSHAAEEFADAIIRIMDLAEQQGFDLGGAIVAKIKHNATRERLHGKEF